MSQAIRKITNLPVNDRRNGWLEILPALPESNVLRQDVRVDYVVVGAGFTGLAAARRLAELKPDASIALVDAGRIGNNAAGRCSGFAIDQAHNIRARNFADEVENEKKQIRLNRAGQDFMRSIVQQHNIQCDWSESGKIHGAATPRGLQLLKAFSVNLDMLDESYRPVDAQEMKSITGIEFYTAGLFTPGTIQMQPAAMVRGFAESMPASVAVYEDTPVTGWVRETPQRFITPSGSICADTLVLTNNGWGSAFGFYEKHLVPMTTFASMTRELTDAENDSLGGEMNWGVIPADPFGSTVRRINCRRLLVRNIYSYTPGINASEAKRRWAGRFHRRSFENRFPMFKHVEFEYTWGGALCLSLNGEPVFGRLSDQVFASICHNGVGICRGTIYGKLLAEQIAGHASELLNIVNAQGRPNKRYPEPLMALGARMDLANRRRRAGLEL